MHLSTLPIGNEVSLVTVGCFPLSSLSGPQVYSLQQEMLDNPRYNPQIFKSSVRCLHKGSGY